MRGQIGALRRAVSVLGGGSYEAEGIWAVGYFVSLVDLDEQLSQRYLRHQENEDMGQPQLPSN